MANSSPTSRKPATRPFSIRLSDDERQALEQAAGSIPLGTYVRGLILSDRPRPSKRRRPLPEAAAIGQLLAFMGQSRLGSDLADLAASARLGTIATTPELEQQLRSACAHVHEIRTSLMRALGLGPGA